MLVTRAPQHPDLSLQLRVRVGERAHVLARLGRTALDLGDSHRALLRGGAQRRRQLLELFHAALFDFELLREALALAAHLVEARLQQEGPVLRAGGVALRHLTRAFEAREHLLHRGELRV